MGALSRFGHIYALGGETNVPIRPMKTPVFSFFARRR
jgi:hypothetical protein